MRHGIARRVRRNYRQLTSIVCALVAAAATLALEPPIAADGTLLDLQLAARERIFASPQPQQSPVAVVALDRRSLDSPELSHYPRVFLEPGWADALSAVMAAGARSAVFDEIFAFDPNTFPGITPNFAQPWLVALHKYRDRVVLARSATTLPARPFAFSAGFDALGLAEISQDPDGRYRHVSARIDSSDGPQPTLAALALQRAGLAMPREVLVAPRHDLESIPTYAMIDVIRCARSDPGALRGAFNQKIVVFGGTLIEEDRKETSDRFLRRAGSDSAAAACGLRRLGASDSRSNTVPGVFLHAAAIEAVATGELTATAPPAIAAAIAALSGGLGAVAALFLAPWTAAVVVAAMASMLASSAIITLQNNYWLPIALPLAALLAAPGVAYSVRYLVEERVRRQVQHAFGHYLAPALVDRLAHDPAGLKLGGERREVTVMFADLSGFSAMSARTDPHALTVSVNRYLGCIVDEVETTGGYVDKFIGDAVMAMWNAPVDDPDHALHAVHAALAAATRIRRLRAEDEARGGEGFFIKIGINSGPVVVGNVGSERRFNYTVIGETVNLASRLERAPDIYSCEVVIGPNTAALLDGRFLIRELDWVLFKGAREPLAVYEPIAPRAQASAHQVAHAGRFAEALRCYRARGFAEAAAIWEQLGSLEAEAIGVVTNSGKIDAPDNPAVVMAERARELAAHPPVHWDGVYVLNLK
jgi:adenylate cyclase